MIKTLLINVKNTKSKALLCSLALFSFFSLVSLNKSYANLTCKQTLIKNRSISQFNDATRAELEIQLSLGIDNILRKIASNKPLFFVPGFTSSLDPKEVFNFTKGTGAYAQTTLESLSESNKENIKRILIDSYISSLTFMAHPNYDELVERSKWTRRENRARSMMRRLMYGRDARGIINKILEDKMDEQLFSFIDENIDSIIENGIKMRVRPNSAWFGRAAGVAVGAAAGFYGYGYVEPTAFSVLIALGAREYLRRERPMVSRFTSHLDD